MTTPPAADGGLPGPLPWRIVDKEDYLAVHDASDNFRIGVDSEDVEELEKIVAWINAQAALLAEKDAEITELTRQVGSAERSKRLIANQLATANERWQVRRP